MDQPPPESPPPTGGSPDPSVRNWAMGCHLAGLIGLLMSPALAHIVAPLVVWLIKREDAAYIDEQGKEALNFQLSITLYALIAGVFAITIILIPLVAIAVGILFLANVILSIMASVKTSNGEAWRYPMTIRFVK